MKRCLVAATVMMALVPAPALAAPPDRRSERQADLDALLRPDALPQAARIRGNCATGKQANQIALIRATGFKDQPDLADYCMTALIRVGRAGTLENIRDVTNSAGTAALAFDRGFVTAYRKRETVQPSHPSMAALKPRAEQCLAQSEPDTDLCFAVGYVYGTRATNGETVRAK